MYTFGDESSSGLDGCPRKMKFVFCSPWFYLIISDHSTTVRKPLCYFTDASNAMTPIHLGCQLLALARDLHIQLIGSATTERTQRSHMSIERGFFFVFFSPAAHCLYSSNAKYLKVEILFSDTIQ